MADLRLPAGEVAPSPQGDGVPPSRYRHPGDVLWLIAAGLLLLLVLAVSLVAEDALWGPDAAVVGGAEPDTAVGRILVGLVQLIAVLAPVLAVGALLWFRRFRLLGRWSAPPSPRRLCSSDSSCCSPPMAQRGSRQSKLSGLVARRRLSGAAAVAAAVGVTLAAGPWLSLSWRRAPG